MRWDTKQKRLNLPKSPEAPRFGHESPPRDGASDRCPAGQLAPQSVAGLESRDPDLLFAIGRPGCWISAKTLHLPLRKNSILKVNRALLIKFAPVGKPGIIHFGAQKCGGFNTDS
jgi:hypothetical protein